jgi:glycosyltransferase involved in cell wall biosynthesis
MIIKLACKLFDGDAAYFMEPILRLKGLKQLYIYRDSQIADLPDVLQSKLIGNYSVKKPKFVRRQFQLSKKPVADIYVGFYEIPHGILAILAAMWNRKPSVVAIIGNPKYSFRNEGIRGVITRWVYKRASRITVTGSESRRFLIEEKGLAAEKVFILPNSIPLGSFRKHNIDKKYDLITLGRLSPEKGLINLLKVAEKLVGINSSFTLGIAGKGPQEEELESHIDSMGLSKNVFLLGFVPDIVEFLNQGRAFITTSKTEGLPRTAIQSMSCGTPVIASNVGDMKDLVIDGKTGYLVDDPEDINAFFEAINMLFSKEEIYSQNCIRHIEMNFSSEAAVKAWENIINSI